MMPAPPNGFLGRGLAVGLVFILVGVVWLVVVQPLNGWYFSRASNLDEKAALLRRQALIAAELPALQQANRRIGHAAPAGNAFLAGSTGAIAGATLEQLLQRMANQNGAALASAEALAPSMDGDYQRIQLRVTTSSDWPSLVNLLQTITISRPAMLVDDLQITAAQITGPAPPISAVFTVIAFQDHHVNPPALDPNTSPGTAP